MRNSGSEIDGHTSTAVIDSDKNTLGDTQLLKRVWMLRILDVPDQIYHQGRKSD